MSVAPNKPTGPLPEIETPSVILKKKLAEQFNKRKSLESSLKEEEESRAKKQDDELNRLREQNKTFLRVEAELERREKAAGTHPSQVSVFERDAPWEVRKYAWERNRDRREGAWQIAADKLQAENSVVRREMEEVAAQEKIIDDDERNLRRFRIWESVINEKGTWADAMSRLYPDDEKYYAEYSKVARKWIDWETPLTWDLVPDNLRNIPDDVFQRMKKNSALRTDQRAKEEADRKASNWATGEFYRDKEGNFRVRSQDKEWEAWQKRLKEGQAAMKKRDIDSYKKTTNFEKWGSMFRELGDMALTRAIGPGANILKQQMRYGMQEAINGVGVVDKKIAQAKTYAKDKIVEVTVDRATKDARAERAKVKKFQNETIRQLLEEAEAHDRLEDDRKRSREMRDRPYSEV